MEEKGTSLYLLACACPSLVEVGLNDEDKSFYNYVLPTDTAKFVMQCRLLFFVSFLGIPLMLTMRYAEGVWKS